MFYFEYEGQEPLEGGENREYVFLSEGRATLKVLSFFLNKKNGQPYEGGMMVKFLVTDKKGNKEYVYDLISGYRVKMLLKCLNMMHLYQKTENNTNVGSFDPNLLKNKTGECEIIIEDKPPYPKKNKISKYIFHDEVENNNQSSQNSSHDDEDIPF